MMSGHCVAERCRCVGIPRWAGSYLFCPHWRMPERPPDRVERASRRNFDRLPEYVRERCVGHLHRRLLAEAPVMLLRWRDQQRRGAAVGGDDPRFHFGVGMAVRNCLREVVADAKMPSGNWDDCYHGALSAACSLPWTLRDDVAFHERLRDKLFGWRKRP